MQFLNGNVIVPSVDGVYNRFIGFIEISEHMINEIFVINRFTKNCEMVRTRLKSLHIFSDGFVPL